MKIFLLGMAAVVCAASTAAVAQGGCNGSGVSCRKLSYYCSLGSNTPLSVRRYCDGGNGAYRGRGRQRDDDFEDRGDRGDRSRALSYEELQYYCAQGENTPISVRRDCIRAGLR